MTLDALGSLAFAAILLIAAVWVTISNYRHDKERGHIPSFADTVDTVACIVILIIVTNWLGIWDAGPRKETGSLAYGEGLARLFKGFLKAVFLVVVPSIFLVNGMRRLGDLGRRAAIYGGFFTLAAVVWLISR